MASTIKLDILTPLGPKRDGVEVPGVEIPGIQGELGVLPQHESLVTAVVPGVVRFRDGVQSVKLAVGAGFLEVKAGGRIVILVERAVEADEVDAQTCQERLEEVKTKLTEHRGPLAAPEHQALITERAWLEAQIRIAS